MKHRKCLLVLLMVFILSAIIPMAVIAGAEDSLTVTVDPAQASYDGTVKNPALTVMDGSTSLSGSDYTVSWSPSEIKNAGTYTVTVTGKGTYAGKTGQATFRVTQVNLADGSKISSARAADLTYTGFPQVPVITFRDGNNVIIEIDSSEYSLKPATYTDVGNYTVEINGNDINYFGQRTANLEIKPANFADVDIEISPESYVFGTESVYEPEVTVKLGAYTLIEGTDYTVAYSNNTAAGTASVTVTPMGNNFTGSARSINFAINAAVAKIGNTLYASFEDAVAAANAMTGEVTIDLLADVTWTTGAAHGSTPFLTADSAVTSLTINGGGHTLTAVGSGVGAIRAANDGTLNFNNMTIKDESVSYAESSWEFRYLEFGGKLNFTDVDFVNGIMITWSNGQQVNCDATFTGCTFNSNLADEYDVWVAQGNATFNNCEFTGYRGAKTHEQYGTEVGTLTFNQCSFTNLSKKPGLAVGDVNADTTVIFDTCTFENVQAGDQGLYVLESDTAITAYNLIFRGPQLVDNVDAIVARIGDRGFITIDSAFAAVKAGDTLEILKAGEYTLPGSLPNITLQGNVEGVKFAHTSGGNISAIPNGITFKNLTFNFGNVNYHGFQSAGTINMVGCTLNGKFFSYGNMNFTECIFNAPGVEASGESSEDYSMWAYAGNITYTDCTFNGAGKFINVYNESGATRYTITATGCTFNSTKSNKAAFNVKETCGTKVLQFTVNLNNNTVNANFPAASGTLNDALMVFSGLVQVDDRVIGGTMEGGEIVVNVDGEQVYITPRKTRVAKIGDVEYVSLVDAFAAAQSGDTVEIIVSEVELPATAVIPAGVTLTGKESDKTTVKITTTNGSGIKITNPNVTIKDLKLDGSAITSAGYNTLVNVRADGCVIDNVVFSGGGTSTWNSSILVEALPATATFTVKNSTITGSFRGVLRESCNANIVIENCDIDAIYPFNIDGGNGGIITVTGSKLHGWTSYSGVEKVTFTNCEFSKGNSGYDVVAAYVDTDFNNCTFDSNFDIYAQTSPFTFQVNDCTKAGTNLTRDNFADNFSDSDVWVKCDTYVNGKLVGAVAEIAGTETKEYKSLQAALDAAQPGETITLLKDISIDTGSDSSSRLPISKSVTIDGDGHTITINNRGFGVGMDAADKIDVTFKDVTLENNADNGRCIDTRGNLNSLTLDGVTLKAAGEATQPLTIGGNQSETASVTITGSTIQTMDDGSYGYAITTFNPVNMTITDSTIKGWACLNIKAASSSAGSAGSTFTITDSELVSKNVYAGDTNEYGAIKVEDNNITVNITDTEINIDGNQNEQAIVSYESGSLTGVKVSMGDGNIVTMTGDATFAQDNSKTAVLAISGGTFNKEVPKDVLADGYKVKDNENGTWTVIESDTEFNYSFDGREVTLSAILEELELYGTPTNVVSDYPALLKVVQSGEDWKVSATKPYSSIEDIIVTLGGKERVIHVTNTATKTVWTELVDRKAPASNYAVIDETNKTVTVSDAVGLAWVAYMTNTNNADWEWFDSWTVQLGADIDLTGYLWEPIGNASTFDGSFDGCNHTISNLRQNVYEQHSDYVGDAWSVKSYYGLFGRFTGVSVKNLVLDHVDVFCEGGNIGAVAGGAWRNVTFENITVKNSHLNGYNYGVGCIVGWATGSAGGDYVMTFSHITVDSSNVINPVYNAADTPMACILGNQGVPSSGSFKTAYDNCELSAQVMQLNDCTMVYDYWQYRDAGMLIGLISGVEPGAADFDQSKYIIIGENVNVTYEDWNQEHYCEFKDLGIRGNHVRVGEPDVHSWAETYERDGHTIVINDMDQHYHRDDEEHDILLIFDQLIGARTGGKGTRKLEGVHVTYYNTVNVNNYPVWTWSTDGTASARFDENGDIVVVDTNPVIGDGIVTATVVYDGDTYIATINVPVAARLVPASDPFDPQAGVPYYVFATAYADAQKAENSDKVLVLLMNDEGDSKYIFDVGMVQKVYMADGVTGFNYAPKDNLVLVITDPETPVTEEIVTYTAVEVVAVRIFTEDGEEKTIGYASLEAAFAAAQDGDTIKLLKDVAIESIAVGKQVTLDLDQHEVSSDKAMLFDVTSNGDLTITGNGKITGPADGQNFDSRTLISVSGKLTIENGTLTATGAGSDGMYGVYVLNGGTAIFGTTDGNGPTITSHFAAIGTNNTTSPATITINGGTYTANAVPSTSDWWSYFCAPIYAPANGTYTINGGTFNGYYGISTRYNDVDQDILIGNVTINSSSGIDVFVDEVNGVGGTVDKHVKSIGNGYTLPDGYAWLKINEDPYVYEVAEAVAKIGDTLYASLKDAIEAVPADGTETTITVIKDHSVDVVGYALTVPSGKNVVLDLNGHTVIGSCSTSGTSAFIRNLGTLTINDSSEDATGKLIGGADPTWTWDGSDNYSGSYASNLFRNEGTLVINSGYLYNASRGSAVYAIDNYGSGKVTINGGTVDAAKASAIRMFYNNGGVVTVNGGSVGHYNSDSDYSYMGIQIMAGDNATVNINGGVVDGMYSVYGSAGTINITDGTFPGYVGAGASVTSISISGGRFGEWVGTWGSHTGFITGGVFKYSPDFEYCGTDTEGNQLYPMMNDDPETKDDYPYTVGIPVAVINDSFGYATLEAAFADAEDGDTIKLLKDTSGNGIQVPQDKFEAGLVVDFGGHTYTVDGTLVGSTGTENQAFQLLMGNNITFKNGTIYSEKALFLVQNYSNLTLDGMTLTLNNANYTSGYTLSNNNGNIVIKDTTINANPAGGFAFDVCRYASYPEVHVTVTGSSVINGDIEVSASANDAQNGFSLMLESGTFTGKLVLDSSAEAAIDTTPEKAWIKRDKTKVEIQIPDGYTWVDLEGNIQILTKLITVSFDPDNGTEVQTVQVPKGQKVEKPEDPTKENYIFQGWFAEGSDTAFDFTNTTITEDITLTAHWKGVSKLVIYSDGLGHILQRFEIEYGQPIPEFTESLEGIVRVGYTYDENNPWIPDPSGNVEGDIVFVINWTKIKLTVTFNVDGGSAVTAQIIDWGDKAAEPTTVKDGYTFLGWFEADATAPFDFDTVIKEDVTLIAKWSLNVAKIGDVYYATLADAFTAAANGDTIELLVDTKIDSIEVNKKVTLDLAGHEITSDKFELFAVNANGDLTITGNGKITGPAHGENFDSKTLISVDGGKLTIENGTLTATGAGSDGMYGVYVLNGGTAVFGTEDGNGPTITSHFAAIGTNNTTAPATITVYGGTYTANANPTNNEWWSYFCAPVYAASSGSFDIKGGTFNGYYGISDRYANVEQSVKLGDVTINASSGIQVFVDEKEGTANNADRTIKSETNTLTVPAGYAWLKLADNEYLLVKAVAQVENAYFATFEEAFAVEGVIGGEKVIKLLENGATYEFVYGDVLKVQKANGEITFVYTAAEGVIVSVSEPDADGVVTYTTVDPVAKIGNTYFATLADAFAAANANDTIVLLKDTKIDSIEVGKKVTLDLDGHEITSDGVELFIVKSAGDLTITGNGKITGPANGAAFDSNALIRVEGGKLTVVNGTLTATGAGSDGMYGVYVLNGGTAVFGTEDGNGPTITSHFAAIGTNNTTAPATITVYGGTYTANANPTNNEWWSYFCAPVYAASAGEYNIYGGTFNGYYGISSRYANVEQNVMIADEATLNGSSGIQVFVDEQTGSVGATDRHIRAEGNERTLPEGYIWKATETAGVYEVAKAVTVTFDVDGDTAAIEAQVIAKGEKATKPADPTKDGAIFAGWTLNGEAYDFSTPVADDITLVATWTEAVAKIGDTLYATLKEAVRAAVDGDTVVLLKDTTESFFVPDVDETITIDLGGHTMTGWLGIDDGPKVTVTNGTIDGTVYVYGGTASDHNSLTVAADAVVNAPYGIILCEAYGTTGPKGYGSTININGTVNGIVWVMGNITEGDSVINVNDGAKITGDDVGIALNGVATVNVYDGATVTGTSATGTGIEVRAGTLNVYGGTITGEGTATNINSNGSGTTTAGAGIAIAQHTTGCDINVNISGGTINGKTGLSIANPEGNTAKNVNVAVTGGIFNGPVTVDESETRVEKFVSGGDFIETVKPEYVVDGKLCTTELTETINGTKYYYIVDAVKVTFDADNGTEAVVVEVPQGESVDKPATDPTKEGYVFVGWFDGNNEYDFSKHVYEDLTLKAHYDENEYDITYEWSDDNKTVTATAVCKNNPAVVEPITETVATTSAVKVPATCEEKGTTTYTAEFENNLFETQTKDVEDIEAAGHDWNEPTYEWSADYSTVTATRTCKNDPTHVETETVTTTGEITTAATCEAKGTTTYTATFTNEAFAAQTKDVEDVDALGHDWGEPVYVWANDYSSVTGTRTCKNDPTHTVTETVTTTTFATVTAATCEEAGEGIWVAEFENELFRTQVKPVVIPATGHDWNEPTYEWADDNSSVTATRTCKNDPAHIETKTVTTTYEDITAATADEDGLRRYTATFTDPYETQTKDVIIPKLGHEDVTVTFDVDGGTPAPEAQTIPYGGYAEKPADPEKAGYIFDGWYLGDEKFDFSTQITENTALKAKWTEGVARIGNTLYATLADAFAAANANDTIVLLKDTKIESIAVDKKVTLNLDGHEVTSDGIELFVVKSTGDLTITGNGTVTGPANGAAFDSKVLIRVDGGKLTIENGTFTATGSGSDGMYGVYVLAGGTAVFGTADGNGPTITSHFAAIGTNNTTAPATITVYGGNYTANAAPTNNEWWSYFCAPVYAASAGEYNIYGGTFNGYYGISSRYANVEQNIMIADEATLTGSSGIQVFVDEQTGSAGTADRHIKAEGNTLTLPEGYIWKATETAGVYEVAKAVTVTFDVDGIAAQTIPEGEKAEKPEDPTKENFIFAGWFLGDALYDFDTPVTESITLNAHWTEAVAKIGDKLYATLADAFAAAVDGDTIELLVDTKIDSIEVGKKVTLDLAGHEITSDGIELFAVTAAGDLTITGNGKITGPANGAAFDSKTLITVDGGKLTIENGTLTATGSGSDGMYGVYVLGGGTAVFGTEDGNGPTITSHFAAIGTNNTTAPATITVYGGTYTANANPTNNEWWSYFCAPVYAAAAGEYNIYGGTFNGYYGISDRYVNVDQNVMIGEDVVINASSRIDVFVDEQTGSAGTADRHIRADGNERTLPEGYTWVPTETEGVYEVAKLVTVTFDADNKDDDTDVTTVEVVKGNKVEKPADPTKDGYRFDGWFEKDAAEAFDFDTEITEDIKLTAKWTKLYTVTFNVDGDTAAIDPQIVGDGEKATKPADPTKEGYTFKGWKLGDADYDFETPVTGDITLTADWTPNKITVWFYPANGEDPFKVEVDYNTAVSAPETDPTMTGYDFAGWFLGDAETAYDFTAKVTEEIILRAHWTAKQYTVTFDPDNGGEPFTQSVDYLGKATKPATDPTKTGYVFLGWYNGDLEYDFNSVITADIELKAHWAENKYEITYEWSDDNKTVTATAVCTNNPAVEPITETVETTSAVKTPAGCETVGTTTYTAEFENDLFETQTKDVEDIEATGHDWNEPEYVWADDYSSVTATRTCKNDPTHVETETVNTTSAVKTPATCEEKGTTTYTATFTNEAFAAQTKDVEDIDATGHDWNEPEYVWADDYSSVTATRTCKNDPTHTETQTVNTTSAVTTEATCEAKGKTTYTATFTNEAFETQTKEVENVEATGHDWNEPTYEWSDDYSTVTATRTCKNDPTHVETETVNTTSTVTTPATCEAKGTATYKAEFENEAFETQTKDGEIAALGHNYGEPTYTWADDNSTVTATVVCLNDSEHTITETKTATFATLTAATCTEAGEGIWIAEFENELFKTQIKTGAIPATGHVYGEPIYEWSADNTTVTAKLVCLNDSTHTITETKTATFGTVTAATCEAEGEGMWVAEFENELFKTQVKTVVIPATGHDWDVPTYEWSADYSSVTATRVCKNDPTHVETETVNTTSAITTEATCEAKGKTTYTAEFTNAAFEKQTKEIENIDAIGHDWNEPTYEWSADYSTVTATRTCKNDPTHVETETVDTTSAITLAATCEAKGKTTYTAVFTNAAFATQTKEVEDIDATGHDWGEPTYEWSADYSTVTATRTCKNDPTHVETETVNTTSAITTEATCEAKGKTTYTAEFTNAAFEKQTKEIENIDATGHDWNEPTYVWADDYGTVTATRTCKNDPTHVETETVNTTSTVKTAATCEAAGTTTYKAEFENEAFADQTKDVVVAALGHNYGEPTYTWADDNSTVTATVVCLNDSEHTITETKPATFATVTAATCGEAGEGIWVAEFENELFKTQVKTVVIPATGHVYGEATYEWSADNSTVTATIVCLNDSTHTVTETKTATFATVTPATCEAEGEGMWVAVFENELFKTQIKTVVIPATGHDWGEPTYEWSADYSTVTATRTCKNDPTHVETETVDTTSAITTEATCEAKGKTTYTAEFTNAAFEKQTKEIENIDATGHDWNEPTYVWADDYSTVTATRTCKNDPTHVETETVDTTSTVKTAATCEAAGTTTYKAEFENEAFAAQTKDVEVAALGHNYGEPTYEWSTDNKTVTATVVCQNDSTHTITETKTATFATVTPATCEEAGEGIWVVEFENELFKTQIKAVAIEATGHVWNEPTYEWAEDYSTVTATAVCANDPTHILTKTVVPEYAVVTAATADEDGLGRYTATFEAPFETQTLDVVIPKLGHEDVTVTFDADGGEPEPDAQTIPYGGYAEKPQDPEMLGFVFDGWYLGDELFDFETTQVTSNIVLKARWKTGEFVVTVTSSGDGTSNPGMTVAHVTGGGTYLLGDKIVVSAPEVTGYTFLGWYEVNGEKLSSDMNFEYTVRAENNDLIAVYEPATGATFRLTVTGSRFTINDGTTQRSRFDDYYTAGGTVTVKYTGSDKFLYWVNDAKKIVSTSPEYTFTLVADTILDAVYSENEASDEALVLFVSAKKYGQVISQRYYTVDETIVFPTAPATMGKTFVRWDKSEEEIRALMATETRIIVYPIYESNGGEYIVTIEYWLNDTKMETEQKDPLEVSTRIPLSVDATYNGAAFSYWMDEEGHILGYKADNLILRPSKDITVRAVYGVECEPEPVVTMTEAFASKNGDKNVINFVATRSIPEGYTIERAGILYAGLNRVSVEEAKDKLTLPFYDGAGHGYILEGPFVGTDLDDAAMLYFSTTQPDRQFIARAYVVLKDADGNLHYVYSDNVIYASYTELTNNVFHSVNINE